MFLFCASLCVTACSLDELDGYLAPEENEEDDGNDSDF